jgi:SAM-dependent methyltransferase
MAHRTERRSTVARRVEPTGSPPEVDWARMYATTPYTQLPWYSPRPGRWLVEAVANGWVRPPGPILDIGCGTGSNALWLSTKGFRVTGLDLAPVAVAVAKGRATRARATATFGEGSILSTPFRDSAFASALDSGCFHALPIADRGRYAEEVARILRPGGSLLLTWIAREETGEYGPPHRPSLEEVTSILEPQFVFANTEFSDNRSPRSWVAQRHRLAVYTARLIRRRTAQPRPR